MNQVRGINLSEWALNHRQMVAFLIALPYVLYQAWAFVAPGL